MDWMKTFSLTIGRIQLTENSQSEREKVFNRFPDFFENTEMMQNTPNKHSTYPGTLPYQTESKTGTKHPLEDGK